MIEGMLTGPLRGLTRTLKLLRCFTSTKNVLNGPMTVRNRKELLPPYAACMREPVNVNALSFTAGSTLPAMCTSDSCDLGFLRASNDTSNTSSTSSAHNTLYSGTSMMGHFPTVQESLTNSPNKRQSELTVPNTLN